MGRIGLDALRRCLEHHRARTCSSSRSRKGFPSFLDRKIGCSAVLVHQSRHIRNITAGEMALDADPVLGILVVLGARPGCSGTVLMSAVSFR